MKRRLLNTAFVLALCLLVISFLVIVCNYADSTYYAPEYQPTQVTDINPFLFFF